jgi:hypothetical protein
MTTHTPAIAETTPTTTHIPPQRRGHPVRNTLLVGSGALLLFGGGLIALVDLHEHHETTFFSASAIHEVVVDIDAGSVTLQPGVGSEVHVTTTRQWSLRPATAGHHIDHGVLTITGGCPSFGFGCDVTEKVTLPAGIAVRVTTGAGGVEATNLNVTSFHSETGAGHVTASFTGSPTDIRATTGAGNVQLSVPEGSYRVDTDSGIGEVNVGVTQADDAPSRIVAETGAGQIDIQGR